MNDLPELEEERDESKSGLTKKARLKAVATAWRLLEPEWVTLAELRRVLPGPDFAAIGNLVAEMQNEGMMEAVLVDDDEGVRHQYRMTYFGLITLGFAPVPKRRT